MVKGIKNANVADVGIRLNVKKHNKHECALVDKKI